MSRNSMSLSERAVRYCNINLPDGSCCSVPIRPGVSIREVLLGLCEKLCINLAAVDLFLVGGEKVTLEYRLFCLLLFLYVRIVMHIKALKCLVLTALLVERQSG